MNQSRRQRMTALCLAVITSAVVHAAPPSSGSVAAAASVRKRLTEETMSQNLRTMEYAVRGAVVIAADKISADIANDPNHKYPFKKIIYTNIGNPHSVGQKALTWPRQVLALVDLPEEAGVNHPAAKKLFPADAIRRAREIKKSLGGHGTGAYSHSKGVASFRKEVAAFISARDGGVPSDPESIFLTNGASSAIGYVLTALIADKKCGVMAPIPQYPIYSASVELLGGNLVGYYLDEKSGWEASMEELERSLADAKKKGIKVNSFVLINPGNPTGQVLSKAAVQDVVKFCAKHSLVLLADEVYQVNVYDENDEFYSCKRAAHDCGLIEDNSLEMVSFHSVSKGLYGECGRRGGYMELVGFDSKVLDQIYKLASSSLCSCLPGQVMVSLMVRGPAEGSESFAAHEAEKETIFKSLIKRSKIVGDGLNDIPGFECTKAAGAMYLFPSVKIPPKAIAESKRQGISPDTLYAVSLLEATGICVVPGSGFRQAEGRYGFRTTFLPQEEEMKAAVGHFKSHYEDFVKQYS